MAFVSVVTSLPSGACRRISLLFLGWRVISNDPVGTESRSEFIGLVVKVVCLGIQPLGCEGGVGGVVRGFFRIFVLGFVYLLMVVVPLGVVGTVSTVTQVNFHVTWNGIERMGVSSSLGRSRLSWSGVSPLCICSHSCLAVSCAVCHLFTW